MKKVILFFVSAAFLSSGFCSQADFARANELYKKEDYQGSVKLYEEILSKGEVSAELYYNLGNAYFKSDNIPAAILNYERARKLAPNDEDIEYNLRMANLNVIDKISTVPEIFYKTWLDSFSRMLSSDNWSYLALACFWIMLASGVLFILSRNPGSKRICFFTGLVFLFLSAAAFSFSYKEYLRMTSSDSAIVFDPSIYVKSSPNEKSTDLFILHEGTKVKVIDEIDGWKRIKIANGNEGWILAKSIEVI